MDFKLASEAFLEECYSNCSKDIGIAGRCLWSNVSHAYLAMRSFLYIPLLIAHVTAVPPNVLWEMVSYSNHKEKDMQELTKVVETSGKTR